MSWYLLVALGTESLLVGSTLPQNAVLPGANPDQSRPKVSTGHRETKEKIFLSGLGPGHVYVHIYIIYHLYLSIAHP